MPFLLHAIADLMFPPVKQFNTAGLPLSAYVSEGSSIKYGPPVESNAPAIAGKTREERKVQQKNIKLQRQKSTFDLISVCFALNI